MAYPWTVLGIDPDTHGGIAYLFGSEPGVVEVSRLATPGTHQVQVGGKSRDRLDATTIRDYVHQIGERTLAMAGVTAYVEIPNGLPMRNSASAALVQGQIIGAYHGSLLTAGVTVVSVTPQEWEKGMGLFDPRGAGNKKLTPAKKHDLHRYVAIDLIENTPALYCPQKIALLGETRHHGMADALLIAAYGHASAGGVDWSNGDELTQSLHACVARVRENPPVYWHPKRSDIPAGPPAILGGDDDDRAARRDMADVLADPIAALSEHPVTAKGTKNDPIVL